MGQAHAAMVAAFCVYETAAEEVRQEQHHTAAPDTSAAAVEGAVVVLGEGRDISGVAGDPFGTAVGQAATGPWAGKCHEAASYPNSSNPWVGIHRS